MKEKLIEIKRFLQKEKWRFLYRYGAARIQNFINPDFLDQEELLFEKKSYQQVWKLFHVLNENITNLLLSLTDEEWFQKQSTNLLIQNTTRTIVSLPEEKLNLLVQQKYLLTEWIREDQEYRTRMEQGDGNHFLSYSNVFQQEEYFFNLQNLEHNFLELQKKYKPAPKKKSS